jgi:hypothetical protein
LIKASECPHKCILHKLFRLFPESDDPGGQRKRPVFMAIDQQGIATGIPRPHLLDYVLVGFAHSSSGLFN